MLAAPGIGFGGLAAI